jgi:hypothetical protein
MALTRVDCHLYRSSNAGPSSSFVAFNPTATPGAISVACATAARDNIGSQVACHLALEHFVAGVLDFFLRDPGAATPSVGAIEAAFRNANSSVYSFGHKLAAGGRMAASLLGMVVTGQSATVGRAGAGSVYLYRDGNLFPFFEPRDLGNEPPQEKLVGARSLIGVDLSTVAIVEADTLVLFSSDYPTTGERDLRTAMERLPLESDEPCRELCRSLFEPDGEPQLMMLARYGPETIYLEPNASRSAEEETRPS